MFVKHPFPSSEQTAALASESGLTVKQVETWFRKKRWGAIWLIFVIY